MVRKIQPRLLISGSNHGGLFVFIYQIQKTDRVTRMPSMTDDVKGNEEGKQHFTVKFCSGPFTA